MRMTITSAAAFAALGVLTAGVLEAQAADLGGGYEAADLEERIAELEATTARKGNRKVSLTISGYVNEQIQWWDDGGESNVYQGTNESDQTRFRFLGKARISNDWSAGYLLEFGVWSARQGQYSADDDEGGDAGLVSIRHSAWYLQSASIGKFTVGQTSAANDGITELTLAKTTTVEKPIQIFSPNAGFRLRQNGSIAGNATWNQLSTIQQAGEGNRYNVVRYDTPVFAGFTASASWGEDDLWAVALRYAGEFSGFRLAGGIGYSEISDGGERNLVDIDGGDGDELGLTASILHVPTGLFATYTYGRATDHDRKLIAGVTGDTDEGWNIQAGIQRSFIPLGKTTLYGEYYRGDFGTAVNLSTNAIRTIGGQDVLSTDVDVWGLAAVQSIDAAALDLYISYRHYEADVTTTGGAKISGIENFQTVFGGAKISF